MRRRLHIYDEIQEFTANAVDFQRAIDVAMSNLRINFALGDKRGVHSVLLEHRAGRALRERELQPLGAHHNAPHQKTRSCSARKTIKFGETLIALEKLND